MKKMAKTNESFKLSVFVPPAGAVNHFHAEPVFCR